MSSLINGLSGELLLYCRAVIKMMRKIPYLDNVSSVLLTRSIPKGLPPLDAVEQVSSRVTRVLAMNPGPSYFAWH